MNAGRAVAVLVLIAGVVAFFLLRHPTPSHAPASKVATTVRDPSPTQSHGSPAFSTGASIESRPAPSRELIASNPDEAAKAWHARSSAVVAEKARRMFGDEVSRLMQLPYADAWDPLVELARNGDTAAAAAAMNIAVACRAQASYLETPHHGKPPAASTFYPHLPETWKPFVDRIAEIEENARTERVADCAKIGGFMDVAMLIFDRFIRADNVDAQVEIAAENNDAHQAIADLREILAGQDNARGRQLLGERLLQSSDAAERAEGLQMLAPIAADDARVAGTIGNCLASGCGGAAPDLVAARPWLEQAAGMGDPIAANRLEQALVAHREDAAAWAWSLYRLDLALSGCLDFMFASHTTIALAAQSEAQRKATLSPAEQNAGLAMSYAIAGRWEKKAKDSLACAE